MERPERSHLEAGGVFAQSWGALIRGRGSMVRDGGVK